MLWCRVPRTLDYPTINLNPRAPSDHNACPSQMDRQTDEHHGNSATICAKNEWIDLTETRHVCIKIWESVIGPRNQSIWCGMRIDGGKDLWKKISFQQPETEERMNDECWEWWWWRRWTSTCETTWKWSRLITTTTRLTEWNTKLVSEIRRCISEWAICDFQGVATRRSSNVGANTAKLTRDWTSCTDSMVWVSFVVRVLCLQSLASIRPDCHWEHRCKNVFMFFK